MLVPPARPSATCYTSHGLGNEVPYFSQSIPSLKIANGCKWFSSPQASLAAKLHTMQPLTAQIASSLIPLQLPALCCGTGGPQVPTRELFAPHVPVANDHEDSLESRGSKVGDDWLPSRMGKPWMDHGGFLHGRLTALNKSRKSLHSS